MKIAALVSLALVLLVAPTSAQTAPPTAPIRVQIEGFIGGKPVDLKPVVTWTVSRGRDSYTLHVTRLRVRSGPLASFTIIKRLEPYPVNFSIDGSRRLLDEFASTPPGEPTMITGVFNLEHGSRVLTLTGVEPNLPPTPALGLSTSPGMGSYEGGNVLP
jgi:hypothetical protein